MQGYSEKELEAAYNMWEPTGLLEGFDKDEASKLAVQLTECYRFVKQDNPDLKRVNGFVFPCMCRVFEHTGSQNINFEGLYERIEEGLEGRSEEFENIQEESKFLNGIVNEYLDKES